MKTVSQLLTELFDKPYHMEKDDAMTELAKQNVHGNFHDTDKITSVNAHKLEGDNGHLVSFMRNGSFEAHHIDKNMKSGELTNHKNVNPRFVSTMIHHLKTHGLDKGRSVRVHAPEHLQRHYRVIAKKIMKDYPNHKMEETEETTKHGKHKGFVIRPISQIEGILEALKTGE